MSDPNRMAIEAIREHYETAVARADMLDQLRAVAVERFEQEQTRAEAAEADLRELRMRHGALVTVARHAATISACVRTETAIKDRLRELLADEGGEWVEKAHCDTIEGELRELRRLVDAWKAAHDESMRSGLAVDASAFYAAEEALRHA